MVKSTHSVFWIDAFSSESATRSFERHAYVIYGQKFSSSKVAIRYFIRYLELLTIRYLLVFDNFDIPNQFPDISEFIPQYAHGSLLFTSRHSHLSELGTVIEIPPMSVEEGTELLFSRTAQGCNKDLITASDIVARLGYLPLAIDQAGSYINARHLPLLSFLEHHEKRRQLILNHIPEIWSYKRQFPEDQQETRLSVSTTWEQSLLACGRTKIEREPYVHFLTLASFFKSCFYISIYVPSVS